MPHHPTPLRGGEFSLHQVGGTNRLRRSFPMVLKIGAGGGVGVGGGDYAEILIQTDVEAGLRKCPAENIAQCPKRNLGDGGVLKPPTTLQTIKRGWLVNPLRKSSCSKRASGKKTSWVWADSEGMFCLNLITCGVCCGPWSLGGRLKPSA